MTSPTHTQKKKKNNNNIQLCITHGYKSVIFLAKGKEHSEDPDFRQIHIGFPPNCPNLRGITVVNYSCFCSTARCARNENGAKLNVMLNGVALRK